MARNHKRGEHVSDLRFDLLLAADDEPAAIKARAEAAAGDCQECRERFATLARARTEFLDSPQSDALRRRLRHQLDSARAVRRPMFGFSLRWTAAFAGAAALAALLLVLAPPRREAPAPDVVRLKGGVAVHSFVLREGRVRPLERGEIVLAGDQIGFQVQSVIDGEVALFATPPPGEPLKAMLPLPGHEPPRVTAGAKFKLPVSALLDDQGDEERFVILICPAPLPLEAATAAARPWIETHLDQDERETAEERFLMALEAASGATCAARLLAFPKEPAAMSASAPGM